MLSYFWGLSGVVPGSAGGRGGGGGGETLCAPTRGHPYRVPITTEWDPS